MNRRKAGEDFYFMHKLLPLGGFRYLPATVFPSNRVSDRVPFGTGRAQWEWMTTGNSRTTYASGIYSILKDFFEQVPTFYDQDASFRNLSPEVAAFLRKHKLEESLLKMKQQSNSEGVFFRRFWQWMDGFMVLKLVHYLRDNGFPNEHVFQVAEYLNQTANDRRIGELIQALKE